MILSGTRRWIFRAVAGLAALLAAGCATTPAPSSPISDQTTEAVTLKRTETLLAMMRQTGWKEVQDFLPLLDEQPAAIYPGVAALADDLQAITAATPAGREAPPIDVGRLIDRNPHFWSAYYEIAPGDPLMAMLHVSLLLAAGEAVRYNLTVALSDAGDFKGADAVFAEAQKRGLRNALETQAWGNYLIKQGRFAEAEAAYGRAARLDPRFAYAPIMRHLARLRQGKSGSARLDPRIEKVDPWGACLLGFLAGRLDEKACSAGWNPRAACVTPNRSASYISCWRSWH